MNSEFLKFMKLWFQKEGDCCPKERWDQFIINQFIEKERQYAIAFTNKLIEKKYIQQIEKNSHAYFVVSGYGSEMINKGILEV